MHRICGAIVLALVASSCSKHEDAKSNAFTLSTGVSVVEVGACSSEPRHSLSVNKQGAEYFVAATGEFSCGSEVQKPYLTLNTEKRATLVLDSVNKSQCECFRPMKVKLAGRLDAGDVLYVLNSGEVLGHVVLP